MLKRHYGSFYQHISSFKHAKTCYGGPTWPNEQFCRWAIIGNMSKQRQNDQNCSNRLIIGRKHLQWAQNRTTTRSKDPTPTPNTPSVEEFNIKRDHESIIDLRYYQIGHWAPLSNFQTVISPSSFDLRSSNSYHSSNVILDAFYQNFSKIKFAVSEKTRWRLKTSKNHLA